MLNNPSPIERNGNTYATLMKKSKNGKDCGNLLDIARQNAWALFDATELAPMLRTSPDFIYACKRDPRCRFPGNKSRPNWIIEFLELPDNEKFNVKDIAKAPARNKKQPQANDVPTAAKPSK